MARSGTDERTKALQKEGRTETGGMGVQFAGEKEYWDCAYEVVVDLSEISRCDAACVCNSGDRDECETNWCDSGELFSELLKEVPVISSDFQGAMN